MREVLKLSSLLILTILLSYCGGVTDNEGENYGNILDSPGGLILTEDEHVGGWGRSDCTTCHNLENIHLENRTDIPMDMDAIREEAIEEGNEGCPTCHGTNGVE